MSDEKSLKVGDTIPLTDEHIKLFEQILENSINDFQQDDFIDTGYIKYKFDKANKQLIVVMIPKVSPM